MSVKIEVSGSDLPEIIDALGGVQLGTVNRLREEAQYHRGTSDGWAKAYDELAKRYDAQAKVRDDTAAQLAAATTLVEDLEQALSSSRDEVVSLRAGAAEHDDSTDSQNKTRFNIDDVERMRADSYENGLAHGYDKGRSEQMAEHAAEALNRTPPLQAMLGYDKVQLHLRNNVPFIFAPARVERHSSYARKYGAKVVGEDVVGITGISELTKTPIFVAGSDVASWSALADAPTKG